MIEFLDIIKNTSAYAKVKEDFEKNTAAHAYFIECSDNLLLKGFLKVCAAIALCPQGCLDCSASKKIFNGVHCDVLSLPDSESKGMSIADVKRIIAECALETVEGRGRAVLIECFGIASDDWQNKLLKILEEPPENTYFFIAAPAADKLLNTVLSRTRQLHLVNVDDGLIADLLVSRGMNAEDVRRAVGLSAGNVTAAIGYENSDRREMLQKVQAFFAEVKNSRQALPFVTEFLKYKERDGELLDAFCTVIYAVLRGYGANGHFEPSSELISREYSAEACAYVIERIADAKRKLNGYGIFAAVIDNLVMQILEVKYRCRK